jgi:3-phosphoshikimate 1-carboxyvinyltransferase
MDLVIGKSPNLRGWVKIPPNKSQSFRALILAALAEGKSRILAPAISNDWMHATEALEMFGATIEPKAGGTWEVTGNGGTLRAPDDVVLCGNSGIMLRFAAALAACCEGYTVLSGDDSLRHIRLCQPLLDTINALGGWAVSTKGDGHAPLVVRGRLKGGRTEMDGMDSQPISAMLIASALADAPTEILVHRPGERPWVRMTLAWLDRLGVEYKNENFERYLLRGRSRWKAFDTRIALDWSAALYPIVAALITPESEVQVPGMDEKDEQGDKAVVQVLRDMGGDITVEGGTVTARSSRLKGKTIDCNDFVDQFSLLAVVGACAEGETRLVNAEVCRHKECDRIARTREALVAMGASAEELPDGLVVRKSRLLPARLNSHQDHRMVMTMSLAALAADGESRISDVECVKKTFPSFVEQMQGIGADMRTA